MTGETGIHWISCMLFNKILWIYDSLGSRNYRPHDDILLDILKEHNIRPYWYNNPSQYTGSVWCGWYAILVCRKVKDCKTIQSANKVVDSLFGNDNKPTLSDELAVLHHFGRK